MLVNRMRVPVSLMVMRVAVPVVVRVAMPMVVRVAVPVVMRVAVIIIRMAMPIVGMTMVVTMAAVPYN